jgi:hypothetical protein
MLKTTSPEFRKFFLLQFTKELINTYIPPEIQKLKVETEEQEKKQKQEIKNIINKKRISPTPILNPKVKQIKTFPSRYQPLPKPLKIQLRTEPLPQRLRYLQPVPSQTNINLGKLTNFLRDPRIAAIECNGPETKIIVENPSPKPTNITLTKEEINEIINEFSEKSKIPIQEGIYKVATGPFILTAIISEIVGAKFIIRRIPQNQMNLMPRRPF